MVRAIKILSWKNDFIRIGLKVALDITDDQIIDSVCRILANGMPKEQYKQEFVRDVNETLGKNYSMKATDKEFVDILVKEKVIEVIEPYIAEADPNRPIHDSNKIMPELRKYWKTSTTKLISTVVAQTETKKIGQATLDL